MGLGVLMDLGEEVFVCVFDGSVDEALGGEDVGHGRIESL